MYISYHKNWQNFFFFSAKLDKLILIFHRLVEPDRSSIVPKSENEVLKISWDPWYYKMYSKINLYKIFLRKVSVQVMLWNFFTESFCDMSQGYVIYITYPCMNWIFWAILVFAVPCYFCNFSIFEFEGRITKFLNNSLTCEKYYYSFYAISIKSQFE